MRSPNHLISKFPARGYGDIAAQPLLVQQDSSAVFCQDLHFLVRSRPVTLRFLQKSSIQLPKNLKCHGMEAIFRDFRGARGQLLIPNRHSCNPYPGARPPSRPLSRSEMVAQQPSVAKNHANPFQILLNFKSEIIPQPIQTTRFSHALGGARI
jgi:hypothetical protein